MTRAVETAPTAIVLTDLRRQPTLRIAAPYYDDSIYIDAMEGGTGGFADHERRGEPMVPSRVCVLVVHRMEQRLHGARAQLGNGDMDRRERRTHVPG